MKERHVCELNACCCHLLSDMLIYDVVVLL